MKKQLLNHFGTLQYSIKAGNSNCFTSHHIAYFSIILTSSDSTHLPVVSPGFISASSSRVIRVTSLLAGLRVWRFLVFLEDSHLRLTKVTWQLLQS